MIQIQSKLNKSNPDGSFTLDDSSSFLSPHEILPIAQENKCLGKLSYSYHEKSVLCVPRRDSSNDYT